MKISKNYIALFFLLAFILPLAGLQRGVALLNITDRATYDSKVFSARQALNVAGIPYTETTDIETATQYSMVVASSRLKNSTLNSLGLQRLTNYVQEGGVLVNPNIANTNLYSVFGVIPQSQSASRYFFIWNTLQNDQSLCWFNEPEEQQMRLGDPQGPRAITTTSYITTGATPLAFYEDGTVAATVNNYGLGAAYTFGFSFKDYVIRNQQDKDYNAETTYASEFLPGSDLLFLWLRGIYQKHTPYPTYLNTAPTTKRCVLVMTHDIDANSNYEMMNDFADLELQYHIPATYLLTTHCFSDYADSDYYTPNISYIQQLMTKNMEIGSHTFGHFPDFDDETVFPIGSPNIAIDNYHPNYQLSGTTGGNVYGELKVSRDIIHRDTGVWSRSYRSGHLAFNEHQPNVLDDLGYSYDSSFSANDVLTNFPYTLRWDNSYGGTISDVLEIPMTISDVGYDDLTSHDMLANWKTVISKNTGNYAPTNLLIHPNRVWKLQREEDLLQWLDDDILVTGLAAYGDFWNQRSQVNYHTVYNGGVLSIVIDTNSLDVLTSQGIIVSDGADLGQVEVSTSLGAPMECSTLVRGTDLIVYNFSQAGQTYPPATPQNINISYDRYNALINWDPVTKTTIGTPISVDYYLIFNSQTASGPYYLHGYTQHNYYTHTGVMLNNTLMYYQIIAVHDQDYSRNTGINSRLKKGITLPQVRRILNGQH